MPLEQPAMIEMVPVGAMVVTVALRSARTAFDVVDGALEVGKHAALFGELDRGGPRLGVDELHELAGQLHASSES